MAQQQTQAYKDAGKRLLAQASEEFALGGFRQASEKGWGAAAQMVKAVSHERGLAHDSHRTLFLTVNELAEETGDREISKLFAVASGLHTNFYEDWMPGGMVGDGLQDMGRFLEKLEPLVR